MNICHCDGDRNGMIAAGRDDHMDTDMEMCDLLANKYSDGEAGVLAGMERSIGVAIGKAIGMAGNFEAGNTAIGTAIGIAIGIVTEVAIETELMISITCAS